MSVFFIILLMYQLGKIECHCNNYVDVSQCGNRCADANRAHIYLLCDIFRKKANAFLKYQNTKDSTDGIQKKILKREYTKTCKQLNTLDNAGKYAGKSNRSFSIVEKGCVNTPWTKQKNV